MSTVTVADTWNKRYLAARQKQGAEKRMWGNSPSYTAFLLISELKEAAKETGGRLKVADVGCGYGRDAINYAQEGFEAKGIDIAAEALVLAREDYAALQKREKIPGSAEFIKGTLRSAYAKKLGEKLDGIASHRALHLMDEEDASDFAQCAAELLRPGGTLAIGARSIVDFKPDEMEWIPGKEGVTAQYIDKETRGDHIMHFLTEERFRQLFGKDFEIVKFEDGCEQESTEKPNVQANLLFMLARRKGEPGPSGTGSN